MWCRAALLTIALTLSASVGSAQSSAAEGSEARARALFDEGVRLAESGHTNEALAIFEEAFTASPRASTAYNIAWVLFSQGRPGAALHALNRADGFPMTDEERSAIDTLRARLRPELATVVVHVRPRNATVCVDEVCDSAGTPVRTIVVDAGSHTVRTSAIDHAPRESLITTSAGATTRLDVELTELPPLLSSPDIDEARRLEAQRQRRVRRVAWSSTGAVVLVGAFVVGFALARRDVDAPYSGIDFGQTP